MSIQESRLNALPLISQVWKKKHFPNIKNISILLIYTNFYTRLQLQRKRCFFFLYYISVLYLILLLGPPYSIVLFWVMRLDEKIYSDVSGVHIINDSLPPHPHTYSIPEYIKDNNFIIINQTLIYNQYCRIQTLFCYVT